MHKKDRRQQMFTLVKAYHSGNQPRKEFCSRHKVSLSTFGWWQHQYRIAHRAEKSGTDNGTPGFLRLMAAPMTDSIEMCFTDGMIVRFPRGIENERLVAILRQLRDGV